MFDSVVDMAVYCYVHILKGALPAALAIGFSNLLVQMIFSAGFSGRLKLGGD